MESNNLSSFFTKEYIAYLLISNIIIILFSSIFTWVTYSPFDNIIKRITLNQKELKIGIISDTQLPPEYYTKNDYYDTFVDHLDRTLRILNSQKIDILIVAGDISDQGATYSYNLFLSRFNHIFKNKKPILNIIMGNHDYWSKEQESASKSQMKFHYAFKQSPFSHKVINGYHFIMWSHENRYLDLTAASKIEWVKEQIEIALKEDKNKPIFVITHMNPFDTVYGSIEWGNINIKNALINYENVISISGHSHFSLIDERSIWQGNFTAIQTQAIAYIELEKGKENGSVPKNEFGQNKPCIKNYMGLIMNVNDEKIEFNRISFEKNEFYGNKWIIELPINKNNFRYTNLEREKKSVAPFWKKEQNKSINVKYMKNAQTNEIKSVLFFEQPFHDNFVHSYEIELIYLKDNSFGGKFLYFSDFYLMPEDREKIIKLGICSYIKSGEYNIKITGIESFGKKSEPIEGTIVVKNE